MCNWSPSYHLEGTAMGFLDLERMRVVRANVFGFRIVASIQCLDPGSPALHVRPMIVSCTVS